MCISCHVTTYRDKLLQNEKFKFDFSESVPSDELTHIDTFSLVCVTL
jgi:hypothetical protein